MDNKRAPAKTKLYNLSIQLSLFHVSFVDCTEGSIGGHNQVEPPNTMFSNNIIIFCPIPDKLLADFLKGKEECTMEPKTPSQGGFVDLVSKSNEEESIGEEQKESVSPAKVLEVAKSLLTSFIANIKMAFNTWTNINIKKTDI